MVENLKRCLGRLLEISIAVLSMPVSGRDTYVVQTSDNMLHFVTDRIESHSLDFIISPVDCPTQTSQGEYHGIQKYTGDGIWSGYMETSASLVPKAIENTTEYDIQDRVSENEHTTLYASKRCIRKTSRIDRLVLEGGGFILVNGRRIYVEDLLMYPVIENGIYLSAAQDHIPRLINNTVIVMANFKVYILDLYDYSSRTIKFNQILHLYSTFKNLSIEGNRTFLNGRIWDFGNKIIAVFILKEKDGFNFMLRVMNDTGVSIYRPRTRRRYRSFILAALLLILIAFHKRNIKYGRCVSKKEKMYLGTFIGGECLIYQVSNHFLEKIREMHFLTKHSSLVNILYDGIRLFQPIIVTEKTFQLDLHGKDIATGCSNAPRGPSNKMRESIRAVVKVIEFLHSRGLIHSRICPENLRITDHGHIRVQNIFDNFGWRSTRQLRNIKNRNYEKSMSDDVFSLGCVIHYFLTGYHPFDPRNFEKTQRKSNRAPLSCKRNNLSTQCNSSCCDRQGFDGILPTQCTILGDGQGMSRHTEALVTLESGVPGISSDSQEIGRDSRDLCSGPSTHCHRKGYCKIQDILAVLCPSKVIEYIKSFPKKKESLNLYFSRVLDDESAASIEYNILFSTCKIRIEDQIEHDFVYHCLKTPSGQTAFSLSNHPYLWEFSRIMDFICDSSDFIETNSYLKQRLERHKRVVFEGLWTDYLDPLVSINVTNKRLYDYHSLCDLVRFIRNCQRHYQELKNKEFFERLDGKVGQYFTDAFPELFMFLYRNPAFRDQSIFGKYH